MQPRELATADACRAPERTRVGLVQARVASDKRQNLEHTLLRLEQLAAAGVGLVCLQELFATPYFCQTADERAFDLAEPEDGPTLQSLREAAKRWQLTIVAPYFERRAPGVYHNSLVVLGRNGETLGRYRKMHIPDDPGFHEKYYFTPGDLGFVTIPSAVGPLGPLICWDQWFPEAARLTALAGARLLIYPTAIGWIAAEKPSLGAAQLDAWRTMQRAHAIANGVFVAAINRVGRERAGDNELEFWGHSFVCDPFGRVLAEAGEDEENLICDLDFTEIERVRKAWPFFRDRRIDAYQDISNRWRE